MADQPINFIEALSRKCAERAFITFMHGYDNGGPPIIHIGEENEWRNWEPMIRFILLAMREPTEAVRRCGINAGWHGGIEGIAEDEMEAAAGLWRAQIDAALGQ